MDCEQLFQLIYCYDMHYSTTEMISNAIPCYLFLLVIAYMNVCVDGYDAICSRY
uniref:Uncharacterized protein n=1 Tax=Anguilla anguilla TaxID=7936 RepID=A0A0E9VCA3_ANGAN